MCERERERERVCVCERERESEVWGLGSQYGMNAAAGVENSAGN